MADEGWGQLSCSHPFRTISPTTRILTRCWAMFLSVAASEGRCQLCAALGYQCGPRQQSRPETSTWPLVITGVMDIYADHCGCIAMKPDLALSGSTSQISPWPLVSCRLLLSGCSCPLSHLQTAYLHNAQADLLFFLSHTFTSQWLQVGHALGGASVCLLPAHYVWQ